MFNWSIFNFKIKQDFLTELLWQKSALLHGHHYTFRVAAHAEVLLFFKAFHKNILSAWHAKNYKIQN